MNLVLFLCYLFPPLGGGGVQRSAKFAKYLPENGWKAVVLSVYQNKRNSIEQGLDFTLLEEVKDKAEIYRVRSVELSLIYSMLRKLHLRKALIVLERMVPFLNMDYKIGWYFAALKKSKEIIEKMPIRIIYSSSSPYSAHLIGYRLKEIYGVPWVADFRDPWTQIGVDLYPTQVHKYIDKRFENAVLNKADRIIANTDRNKINLVKAFKLDPDKIEVIPNGFDPEDFSEIYFPENNSQFIISCLGKFHEMEQPDLFFKAYRRFYEKHNNVLLKLIGWHSRPIRKIAQAFIPPQSWVSSERMEHGMAIQIMRSSSILLGNVPNMNCSHWVPGKIYEYLAVGRPILFLGPQDGEAAEIIRKTNTGRVVGFDEESIFEALEELFELWEKKFAGWNPNREEIYEYNRKRQTEKLARIFHQLY